MFYRVFVFAIALLVANAIPGKQAPIPTLRPTLTNEQLSRLARKSVVVIYCGVKQGESVFGSGFVVDKIGMIATNAHVVESCADITVEEFGSKIRRPAYVLRKDPSRDIAILYVSATNAAPLSLSGRKFVAVGTSILAVGHPEGLDFTVSDGIVSALREISPGHVLVQITAPISPGSSGGPVLDHSGQVVGMSTLYLKEGQNLNFAVAATDIRAALDAAREQLRAKTGKAETPDSRGSETIQNPPERTLDTFKGEISPDESARELAQKAKGLRLQKRYSDARGVIEEGLSKFPSNVSILLEATELAFSVKNYSEADTHTRKMLALDPSFAPAHQCLSALLSNSKQYDVTQTPKPGPGES